MWNLKKWYERTYLPNRNRLTQETKLGLPNGKCRGDRVAAHQAPPSLGFSRQEHWSGLPLPSPMHESEKWKWSRSVMSDSLWPHGLQPTRLLYPWDFPDKSTGVVIPLMIQFIARLPIVSEARIASVATSSSIIYPVTDPRCFLRLAS